MFQTFETSADPTLAKPRVTALRAELARRGLDATILPRADEHQGEYVPTCAERLHWLTGFSGSAGFAAVTAKAAAVFVDGRYTVQAKAEVDTKLFEIEPLKPGALAGWLADNLADGAVVGFDPALWTIRQVEDLERALEPKGIKLRAVRTNLVDRIWGKDRPPAPMAPVRLQPVERSGREAADKIAGIQSELDKDGHDACVLTLPDSISWLFNIRGADVAHNPVVLAFAILHRRARPELFIAPEKLDKETRAALKQVARLKKPADLDESLKALREAGKRVRLDPATAAFRFLRALGARNVARASDPCILPKARKNETEIAGARRAHVRDGAAVVRFLAWLDEAAGSGEALDEITAVRRLEAFRAETGELAEISFDTISGSGPNGAIVHYRVNETTNRALGPGELFLIDSGAQYVDGTTDITRTVAIGAPAPGMIRDTTLVLKGHIAIATALFPKGTRGIDLDPFARRALWADGLDYES